MGVARAGRGRSVAVDVDPNVQKKFENFLKNFWEVTPGSPSPRKPHINTGIPSNTDPLGQQASIGGFGVVKSSALHWPRSCPCFFLHSLSSLLRSLFLDLVLMPGILQPKACLLVTGVGTLLWSFLWCRSNTGEDPL